MFFSQFDNTRFGNDGFVGDLPGSTRLRATSALTNENFLLINTAGFYWAALALLIRPEQTTTLKTNQPKPAKARSRSSIGAVRSPQSTEAILEAAAALLNECGYQVHDGCAGQACGLKQADHLPMVVQ